MSLLRYIAYNEIDAWCVGDVNYFKRRGLPIPKGLKVPLYDVIIDVLHGSFECGICMETIKRGKIQKCKRCVNITCISCYKHFSFTDPCPYCRNPDYQQNIYKIKKKRKIKPKENTYPKIDHHKKYYSKVKHRRKKDFRRLH
jgi:hypothetical protein